MKKTLHIYILKEIIPTFITSLFVLTFVLMMDKILKLTEMVLNKGVPFVKVLKLFMYITPSLLVVTVPMAMLIAILFAFARFSSDSEITAMKSCGISLYNMFPPVMIVACVMYAATSLLMIYALPHGNFMFKKSVYEIVSKRLDIGIKERIFNDDFADIVIYANEINDETGQLSGVMVSDARESGESHTIIADSGSIVTSEEKMEVMMMLKDGTIHRRAPGEEYFTISFDTYQFRLAMGTVGAAGGVTKDNKEMTIAELKYRISEMQEQGAETNTEQVELYKKFSLPFACIVFGIIASPLGIYSRRSGKSKGFTIAICVILTYYLLLILGESLGKRGIVAPLIMMWMPNVVIGLAGLYIFNQSAKESPIRLFDSIGHMFDSAWENIKKVLGRTI